MKQQSIGILCVYFGKLPNYFPVWLESCKNNKTIDFYVVTDQTVNTSISNVKFISSTLEQFQEQASEMFGFKVVIDTPFKLCDFKPAYGMLFQDILKDYDYWGHCDIDLIWGDLRGFFDKYHLEQYDKFLPLGHLSLYRNTYENNRRFMQNVEGISNYKKIFQSNLCYLFDELALIRIYTGNYAFFDDIIFADIWPWKKRYTLCTQLKYYPSIYHKMAERLGSVNFNNQIFLWLNGKIYQYYMSGNTIDRREYIYIHLQKRKWQLEGEFSSQMYISQNRVAPITTEVLDIPCLINTFNQYNWYRDLLDDVREFVAHCWSYFKRRIIKTEPQRIIIENS